MSEAPRQSDKKIKPGMALLTRRDAREVRWVANWASLATDLLLDPSVAASIRATLARPDVQDAIRNAEAADVR